MDVFNFLKNSFRLYVGNNSSLKYIDKNVSWFQAIIVGFVIGQIFSLIFILLSESFASGIFMWIVGVFVSALLVGLGIYIFIGFIHLLYKWLGGQAKFVDTIKFSSSVGILSGIVYGIFEILRELFVPVIKVSSGIFGFSGAEVTESVYQMTPFYIFLILVVLAFAIWSIVTQIKVLAKVHKISNLRSLGVFCLSILIFVLIVLLIFIIGAMLFSSSLFF